MPIVPRLRWGDLSSWGLWLIVVLVMVSSRGACVGRGLHSQLSCRLHGCPPSLWRYGHSPSAVVPWFSRSLRARWHWAWYSVEAWRRAGQAWLLLLARLSTCRTLADLIGMLTVDVSGVIWECCPCCTRCWNACRCV